ncbi:hypothetical protein LINPERPRIM_LOCUS6032 [Linum perenne]
MMNLHGTQSTTRSSKLCLTCHLSPRNP